MSLTINSKTFKKLMVMSLGATFLLAPSYLLAQQDQVSVVDAARRARAARKDAPKSKLVIDNDNLDTLTGVVSVVGQPPAPPEKAAAPGKEKAPAEAAKPPVKGEAYWRSKFADANKKLSEDARELDILQREYNLKQEQFYTNPMASLTQGYDRQDLNDTKTKIDNMTNTVAQDKQDISNLEDELRRAGGDPGWARPQSTPPAQPAP
ncbi:MAG TPA: hypothetical protein VNI36_06145 [Candidatus Dormibacteraeota bacterium]|nr:hypothetical protein [Candidatus Dormibacteraeota bacterium]